MLATLVDTDALWHAALYAIVGGMVFVGAFGVAIFARDRAAVRDRAIAWNAVLYVSLVACLGVLVLGVWAMTQKPS